MKPFLLVLVNLVFVYTTAQNTLKTTSLQNSLERYTYKNGKTSYERWYKGKTTDSIKSYYKTGQLDEVFYFKNDKYHGNAYKYNIEGQKLTTWTFNNGQLIKRIDHKLRFNKKDILKKKQTYRELDSLNALLITNPKDRKSRFQRIYIRYYLGDNILTLRDLKWLEQGMDNLAKRKNKTYYTKTQSKTYDRLKSVYSRLGMRNHACHYAHKAIKNAPKNNRLLYNFGAYLYSIGDYRLAEHYLNRALSTWPTHSFSHRILAIIYTKYEDYEKAKYHIDIAFSKEKNLLKYGFANIDRDVRTQRGFILHKLGETENGIIDLKEAIRLNKNNSLAHRNLGVLYHDIGANEQACYYFQKAKTLHYQALYGVKELNDYIQASCNSNTTSKTETRSPQPINPNKKPFIYPNPTTGIIHVKHIPFNNFNYTVFNYTGSLVYRGVSNGNTLNISKLQQGVYIVNISKDTHKETFRVIKE
jgi:Tfp pilus assembly protein PilF